MAVSWLLAIPLLLFLLINLKSLPLVWHFRLFTFLLQSRSWLKPLQLSQSKQSSLTRTTSSTPILFQSLIFHTRSPLFEIDYYLHKSNATFVSDVDIARSHLVAALVWPLLRNPPATLLPGGQVKKGQMLAIMLGSVNCQFRREIKPYQRYEIWTRVLTWDEKWVYFVSHFVRAGAVKGARSFTLEQRPPVLSRRGGVGAQRPEEVSKAVLATAVSKNVLKLGRATVRPEDVWRAAGLLPQNKEELERVEKMRLRGLKALVDKDGNAMHGLFEEFVELDDSGAVLGEYRDVWAWS